MNIDIRHLSLATRDPVAPFPRLTDTRASPVLMVDDECRRSYRLWASLSALPGDDTIATVESADEALEHIHPRPPTRSSWPSRSTRVMD